MKIFEGQLDELQVETFGVLGFSLLSSAFSRFDLFSFVACWRIFGAIFAYLNIGKRSLLGGCFRRIGRRTASLLASIVPIGERVMLATKEQILQTPDRLAVLNTTIERALRQLKATVMILW